MEEFNFPKIKKTICDFLSEEDGSMTRKKVVAIGSILLIMSLLTPVDAYAKHVSHSSHVSGDGIHSNSHSSHASAVTQHSNHASHYSTTATTTVTTTTTSSTTPTTTTTTAATTVPDLKSVQLIHTPQETPEIGTGVEASVYIPDLKNDAIDAKD